jgi:DNA primase
MPGIDYRQLRRQIAMGQVLHLIGFRPLGQHGPQLRGPCPIPGCHSSSHRTFSVHLTRQVYRCFACGSHGNPLDLWAAVHSLPIYQAASDLCRALNITPARLDASALLSARRGSHRVTVASHAPSRNH